jgi:hypothetical protein
MNVQNYLSSDEILSAIVNHGLSIRQIPKTVTSLHEVRHAKPGDNIVEHELFGHDFDRLKRYVTSSDNWRFDDASRRVFRRYVRTIRTPKYAGFWMCQQVTNTSSTVLWRKTDHNLASTLEESVRIFLAKSKQHLLTPQSYE